MIINNDEENHYKIIDIKEYKKAKKQYRKNIFFHSVNAVASVFLTMITTMLFIEEEDRRLLKAITILLFTITSIFHVLQIKENIKNRRDINKKIELLEQNDEKVKVKKYEY